MITFIFSGSLFFYFWRKQNVNHVAFLNILFFLHVQQNKSGPCISSAATEQTRIYIGKGWKANSVLSQNTWAAERHYTTCRMIYNWRKRCDRHRKWPAMRFNLRTPWLQSSNGSSGFWGGFFLLFLHFGSFVHTVATRQLCSMLRCNKSVISIALPNEPE